MPTKRGGWWGRGAEKGTKPRGGGCPYPWGWEGHTDADAVAGPPGAGAVEAGGLSGGANSLLNRDLLPDMHTNWDGGWGGDGG